MVIGKSSAIGIEVLGSPPKLAPEELLDFRQLGELDSSRHMCRVAHDAGDWPRVAEVEVGDGEGLGLSLPPLQYRVIRDLIGASTQLHDSLASLAPPEIFCLERPLRDRSDR
jgi:hypothetical protein